MTGLLTFSVVPVSAGMINMAAREASEAAPHWRDILGHSATYIVTIELWLVLVTALALLLADLPLAVIFIMCAIVLALLLTRSAARSAS